MWACLKSPKKYVGFIRSLSLINNKYLKEDSDPEWKVTIPLCWWEHIFKGRFPFSEDEFVLGLLAWA